MLVNEAKVLKTFILLVSDEWMSDNLGKLMFQLITSLILCDLSPQRVF